MSVYFLKSYFFFFQCCTTSCQLESDKSCIPSGPISTSLQAFPSHLGPASPSPAFAPTFVPTFFPTSVASFGNPAIPTPTLLTLALAAIALSVSRSSGHVNCGVVAIGEATKDQDFSEKTCQLQAREERNSVIFF